MLLRNQSNKINLFKYSLLIPIIGILVVVISAGKGINNGLDLNNVFSNDTVFNEVDVAPKYKGGKKALNAHFKKYLVYPDEAKENNIRSMVGAGFIVNKDGSVSDVTLHNNPGYGIKKVVRNTLLNMEWIPGTKDGKIVRTRMMIPIMFSPDNKPYSMLKSGSAQPVFSDSVIFISKEKGVKKTKVNIPDEDDVYSVVDKSPSFKGGHKARLRFIANNFEYPEKARKNGVQGTVYLRFIVEPDGSISNTEVLRGIGSGCDEEAVRVVESMPKWEPGEEDGKPVRSMINMPMKFELSKNNQK